MLLMMSPSQENVPVSPVDPSVSGESDSVTVLVTMLVSALATVLATVFATVFATVSATVGDFVCDGVGDGVGDCFGDGVGDSVCDCVSDSVGDFVDDGVGDFIGDGVGDSLTNQKPGPWYHCAQMVLIGFFQDESLLVTTHLSLSLSQGGASQHALGGGAGWRGEPGGAGGELLQRAAGPGCLWQHEQRRAARVGVST